jgi:hypothetical protein
MMVPKFPTVSVGLMYRFEVAKFIPPEPPPRPLPPNKYNNEIAPLSTNSRTKRISDLFFWAVTPGSLAG